MSFGAVLQPTFIHLEPITHGQEKALGGISGPLFKHPYIIITYSQKIAKFPLIQTTVDPEIFDPFRKQFNFLQFFHFFPVGVLTRAEQCYILGTMLMINIGQISIKSKQNSGLIHLTDRSPMAPAVSSKLAAGA